MTKKRRKKRFTITYEPDYVCDSLTVKAYSKKHAKKIALEEEDIEEYQILDIKQERKS